MLNFGLVAVAMEMEAALFKSFMLCCANCWSTAERVESLTPPERSRDSRRSSSDCGYGVAILTVEIAGLLFASGVASHVTVMPGRRLAARESAKFMRLMSALVLTHVSRSEEHTV